MIRYPDCDEDDCWYKRHSHRINESIPSIKYWVNYESSLYDRRKNRNVHFRQSYPVKGGAYFHLCDVCNGNSHYSKDSIRCSICNRNMVNLWIKSNDDHYCCDCISEETVMEAMNRVKMVGAPNNIAWGIIVATQHDTKGLQSWKTVLTLSIEMGKLEYKDYKDYSRKRKRETFEKNRKAIKKWIPNMSQEDGETLAKRFRTELPECYSTLKFIDTLIEQSQDK